MKICSQPHSDKKILKSVKKKERKSKKDKEYQVDAHEPSPSIQQALYTAKLLGKF